MVIKGAKPKKQPPRTDKAQFERFIATARKLGANESVEDFEVKFKKIVPPKRTAKLPQTRGSDR
jgi:hypothetical protein